MKETRVEFRRDFCDRYKARDKKIFYFLLFFFIFDRNIDDVRNSNIVDSHQNNSIALANQLDFLLFVFNQFRLFLLSVPFF